MILLRFERRSHVEPVGETCESVTSPSPSDGEDERRSRISSGRGREVDESGQLIIVFLRMSSSHIFFVLLRVKELHYRNVLEKYFQ